MELAGILIAVGTGLGFLFVLGVEIRSSFKKRPTYWIRTPTTKIGVRWQTLDQNWPGFERALRAIEHVLLLRYGAEVVRKKKLLDFWVDVFPRNTLIRTSANPTGKWQNRTVNGSLERIALFFGLTQQHVVLVMQHHKTKTKLPTGETWQEGELLSADNSALFHEVAEHYVPLRLKGDVNTGHAEEWKLLTLEMRRAYRLLEEAEK